jgi:hypothetical protein
VLYKQEDESNMLFLFFIKKHIKENLLMLDIDNQNQKNLSQNKPNIFTDTQSVRWCLVTKRHCTTECVEVLTVALSVIELPSTSQACWSKFGNLE